MAAICQLFIVLPLIVKGKKSTIIRKAFVLFCFYTAIPNLLVGNCIQKDVSWDCKVILLKTSLCQIPFLLCDTHLHCLQGASLCTGNKGFENLREKKEVNLKYWLKDEDILENKDSSS